MYRPVPLSKPAPLYFFRSRPVEITSPAVLHGPVPPFSSLPLEITVPSRRDTVNLPSRPAKKNFTVVTYRPLPPTQLVSSRPRYTDVRRLVPFIPTENLRKNEISKKLDRICFFLAEGALVLMYLYNELKVQITNDQKKSRITHYLIFFFSFFPPECSYFIFPPATPATATTHRICMSCL